ncbi:LysM peptidoglycan-binding domain-containing protein [Sulfurovum lithotrophicum]|uniref:LysM peptidoglycan-binding domain-containing protein n=1 Tax=Sulfurovum lithotrophicum TaxID=206403 RepID=UPI000A00956A|nr:LysM peptidoglycan-binding domain-containing protein [Sulfurovum lithotrophicum]
MYRKYSAFLLFASITVSSLSAKGIVECRVITGGTTECNPYSKRLLVAKEVSYDIDKQKLIVTKTLPVPVKKPKLKVISVADMIEKYIHISDSMRYRGSEEMTSKEKELIRKQEALKKIKRLKEEQRLDRLEEERLAQKAKEQIQKEKILKEQKVQQGFYVIAKGDTLSTIAAKYGMKTRELLELNQLKKDAKIRLGKKLLLPYPQNIIDAIASGEYKVQEGDTLISIARKFNLKPKDVAKFNELKTTALIRVGKTIQLPLPYRLKALEAKKKAEEKKRKLAKALKKRKGSKLIRGFGKRKLRVTATAYSSHRGQTDKTPFLAAWNNHIRPGMKIIAVSRDLLTKYGLRNGSRVRIGGLPGIYRVRDKMNKRFRKRIDIYMGINRRKALRWGRRSVMLYW